MDKRNPKESGRFPWGFLAMDKETTLKMELRWARILVKVEDKKKLSSINMLAGARNYEIQIWWEIQPWVAEVFP